MSVRDRSFLADQGLQRALALLSESPSGPGLLPETLPEKGLGERPTLEALAPHVLGKAARLDAPLAQAHMDPPTPWITWAMAMWNARLNQNLLHQATAPFAREAETRVLEWLAPLFGMGGGHMCSGSTIANLTALWAAREVKHANRVIASAAAHLSIEKAACILGMELEEIPADKNGRLDPHGLGALDDACLVLTAGTTSVGAIDPLELTSRASWTHIDAAWAGPLRLSDRHRHLLGGIDRADSVAISGHKWLFQPKDSAMIMFAEPDLAEAAIRFGGGYLADPNVGVQGSRGAAAIPLLATLIAWGRAGIAERIDRSMAMAEELAHAVGCSDALSLWAMPTTGITVFRPRRASAEEFLAGLPQGMLSTCMIGKESWLRSVAANPVADIEAICAAVVERARRLDV